MQEIMYPAACKYCAYCFKKPNGKRSILTCQNVISPKHKQVITAKDYCTRFSLQAEPAIMYREPFSVAAILHHTKTLEYVFIENVEGVLIKNVHGSYVDDSGKVYNPPYKVGDLISIYLNVMFAETEKIATVKVTVEVCPVPLLSISNEHANNVIGLSNDPKAREKYLESVYAKYGVFNMPAYLWAVYFTRIPDETSNQ